MLNKAAVCAGCDATHVSVADADSFGYVSANFSTRLVLGLYMLARAYVCGVRVWAGAGRGTPHSARVHAQ